MHLSLKRLLMAALIVVFSFSHPGCKPGKSKQNKILVKTNDFTITLKEFNRRFESISSWYSPLVIARTDIIKKLKRDFLNRLIEEKLLLMRAKKLEITVSRPELENEVEELKAGYSQAGFQKMLDDEHLDYDQWMKYIENRLLMERVFSLELNPRISVDKPEAESYYQRHVREYHKPEQVRARQIVVNTEKEALIILREIKDGADFSELAQKKSLSPDGQQGGKLGIFSRGEMPHEFEEAIFCLKPGKLSTIVGSSYGYHIFIVDEKVKAAQVPFLKVEDEITEKIWIEKQKTAYGRWMEELKNQTSIKINEKYID